MLTRLKLNTEWIIGEQIGAGGFGRVYAARSHMCERAVVKLIPKERGADRELLFVNMDGVRNVVPIIDSGETDDSWALVMPRADQSLREYFNSIGDRLDANAALPVLMNVAVALADIDGKIVHRDLKPENILLLKGIWCLADFGISRYAEATTAQETHKYALSAPYAAPERWRSERATSATDMYSFGAIAFELVTGALPFTGPRLEDFREQHLHLSPRVPPDVPAHLGALIEECLYKAPGARPGPSNTIERLIRIAKAEPRGGLAKLQQANRAEIVRKGESTAQESAARSAGERREDLATSAAKNLVSISETIKNAILEVASTALYQNDGARGWTLKLGGASLTFGPLDALLSSNMSNPPPAPFATIACSSLILSIPPDRSGYVGRSAGFPLIGPT
jgi:serine/threonine protein kinase